MNPERIGWLCSAAAVRERCAEVYALALRDELPHFSLQLGRLEACVELVAKTTRDNYPDLAIPYHSRWRHFSIDGADRWQALREAHPELDGDALARTGIDLAVTSVLLDAGAGPDWRYRTRGGGPIGRSEGLALASLDMFATGLFSTDPATPLCAHTTALAQLDETRLARALQSTPDNPLLGVTGRCELLRSLGRELHAQLAGVVTSEAPRVGHLFDVLRARSVDGRLPASAILDELLQRLVGIWPHAQRCNGVAIGDVGRHAAIRHADVTDGQVPLHKLSQWLAYSLVEPLEWAGIEVCALDELTGLAEYRNGGLFIDTGVLRPRDPQLLHAPLEIYAEPVVEWRALTVALLDRVAERLRERFALDAGQLPLAKVLQGGTWSAGRRIARQLRTDGGPPVRLASDGTVF